MITLRYLLLSSFVLLAASTSNCAYAQHGKADSLVSYVSTAVDDTGKVKVLDDVAWEYIYSEPQKALIYANQELALATKLHWKKGIAMAENSIGIYYNSQGDFANTLAHFLKALKLREEISDKRGVASLYCNIGNVYRNQDNFAEALDYYTKALKLAQEVGNKQLQAVDISNIGIIYAHQNNADKALDNFTKALKLNEEIGNKVGISTCLGNIGLIYCTKGDYDKALDCYFKAVKIDEENGNKNGKTRELNNIGSLYIRQKKYAEAEKYLTQSLLMAKEIGSKSLIEDNYVFFARLDSAQGNYKQALEHYKMYIIYRDSITNEQVREKNMQMAMQYDFDKKQAAVQAAQEKKDAISGQEKRKQKILIAAISGGLFLLFVIAVIIFRSLRVTQQQKKIITEKSEQLGEALKSVKDSITYAKRIQQAKLPKQEDIDTAFRDNFILFRPKDIVSGDFYYFHKNERGIYIAAVDCTGHGVPGAFMSLIGYEKLEEAITHSNDPSEILNQLNKRIKTSLKQTDNTASTRDGMDIALCEVDLLTRTIKYAGANRPLWIIRNGSNVVEEIKATKKAIGGLTDDNQQFETHEIHLNSGDAFYIFSDGYADTFSGKTNKKLTTRKFKELLLSVKDTNMLSQKTFLNDFIKEWQAGTEPVDDILVMGIRL
ncbi:MAG: hypothetical protein JWP12_2842 [Bacteroidetes bacterium]|nr:hypothetical protein [Bacteroidota bacterium]